MTTVPRQGMPARTPTAAAVSLPPRVNLPRSAASQELDAGTFVERSRERAEDGRGLRDSGPSAPPTVLDVGCGSGEVLIRLHERFSIQGVGIDVSEEQIAEAAGGRKARGDGNAIRFSRPTARTLEIAPSRSTWPCVSALDPRLRTRQRRLRIAAAPEITALGAAGALVLVGDLHLKHPASPEYRAVIGTFRPMTGRMPRTSASEETWGWFQ